MPYPLALLAHRPPEEVIGAVLVAKVGVMLSVDKGAPGGSTSVPN